MAADATLKPSCQKSHDNLFFDYVGDNPKWKPVSLTHVEYPKGTFTRLNSKSTSIMAKNCWWFEKACRNFDDCPSAFSEILDLFVQ